jgi:hypothetical protein
MASASANTDPAASGWILICGGVFEVLYGPMLWRNYRGIANQPTRGLGLKGQRRLGMILTFAAPLTITMGVLILLGRYLWSSYYSRVS